MPGGVNQSLSMDLSWKLQYRTDNIEEDTKYYKKISGLNNKSGNKEVEHGNSHPRKCKFYLHPRSYHLPQLRALSTS